MEDQSPANKRRGRLEITPSSSERRIDPIAAKHKRQLQNYTEFKVKRGLLMFKCCYIFNGI